ncbi:MAG TPA: transferrin receptor-like dimerization domain-containing protein, partial [Thermoanaerobaculia bacterium]|nr:transferrin receptor-like dimerization domain-containing protein [Thermoanaerobaculia bacterium]
LAAGRLAPADLAAAHRALVAADRAWVDPGGLAGRPWYRNLFAAPDADSGYAAWVLPDLVAAVEARDGAALTAAAERVRSALFRLEDAARALAEAAGAAPAAARDASRSAEPAAVEPARGGER